MSTTETCKLLIPRENHLYYHGPVISTRITLWSSWSRIRKLLEHTLLYKKGVVPALLQLLRYSSSQLSLSYHCLTRFSSNYDATFWLSTFCFFSSFTYYCIWSHCLLQKWSCSGNTAAAQLPISCSWCISATATWHCSTHASATATTCNVPAACHVPPITQ